MTALSDPITLRVPIDVLKDVEEIGRLTERTRSWVIVRALRTYLANEGADVLAVAEGRAQIARGEAYDLDEVLDTLDGGEADKAAS